MKVVDASKYDQLDTKPAFALDFRHVYTRKHYLHIPQKHDNSKVEIPRALCCEVTAAEQIRRHAVADKDKLSQVLSDYPVLTFRTRDGVYRAFAYTPVVTVRRRKWSFRC